MSTKIRNPTIEDPSDYKLVYAKWEPNSDGITEMIHIEQGQKTIYDVTLYDTGKIQAEKLLPEEPETENLRNAVKKAIRLLR